MKRRIAFSLLGATFFAFSAQLVLAEAGLRPAVGRPEVQEVGDPVMINRDLLQREMGRNIELRRWIESYGWPDYAEVQEVTVIDPLATYEVRLHYLRRNQTLAFSRVHVAPVLEDYGIQMYEGPIPKATLDRILTAQPGESDSAL